jgi:4-hydroxy-tetrahydrodipicolinate synthase
VGALNARLEPVWRLFRTHGSYRVVHLAAALAGFGACRPPLPVRPLTGEAAAEVERVFGEALQ